MLLGESASLGEVPPALVPMSRAMGETGIGIFCSLGEEVYFGIMFYLFFLPTLVFSKSLTMGGKEDIVAMQKVLNQEATTQVRKFF